MYSSPVGIYVHERKTELSKLRLLLAVAALAGLVFAGVIVNRSSTAASGMAQPHTGVHAPPAPGANAAEKQVVLRGLGMT